MNTCLNMYVCKNICMYMFVYFHDTVSLIVMKPIYVKGLLSIKIRYTISIFFMIKVKKI